MSMIGDFGLCKKSDYDNLLNLMNSSQFDEIENLVAKISEELGNSKPQLENNKCSGEVFLALFHYFKTELGIDIYKNKELEKLSQCWRELTGDHDIVIFYEKEKPLFSSLLQTTDYSEIAKYINEFFQTDYQDAGQIACKVFLENLKKLDSDNILIWHLY